MRKLSALSFYLLNFFQYRVGLSRHILAYLLPLQLGLGLSKEAGETSRVLGDLESLAGNFTRAKSLYQDAMKLFQQTTDHNGLGNSKLALAEMEFKLNHFAEAQTLYTDAVELFRQSSNNPGLANAILGIWNLKRRGFAVAVEADLQEAISLFRDEHDNLGLAATLLILGEEHHRTNMTNEARQLYESAIELYGEERNNLGVANATLHLGILESGIGALVDGQVDLPESVGTKCLAGLERARKLLVEARELYIGESYHLGTAVTTVLLGRISHLVGNGLQRDEYLDEALKAAQTCNLPGILKFVKDEEQALRPKTL